MQSVANEMNLAETAFLYPDGDVFQLRWFTPLAEVKLCGHATLASAHLLWEQNRLPAGTRAKFQTLSGLLTADQQADGWIKLDFPASTPTVAPDPGGMLAALGIPSARFIGRSAFDYLVEVDSHEVVRSLTPDLNSLKRVEARGVIVTARSSSGEFDFISRFFAPAVGVPEDPVTGSAHCALAPYWGEQLGMTDMIGYQASPRGGVVKVAVRDDRVWLYGQAVTVMDGELRA
jgi:PhzF family phenazine biosynthesis protein